MTPIEIFIPGKPMAKERPRGPNFYTPTRTRAKEREVAQLAKIAMIGRQPFTGPVAVTIKAWMKGARTAKPDADNCGKLYLDALNGIVYGDDAQVVDLHIRKLTGSDPQVAIRVEDAA